MHLRRRSTALGIKGIQRHWTEAIIRAKLGVEQKFAKQ